MNHVNPPVTNHVMIYTPVEHIPMFCAYRDPCGSIHFIVKRSGKPCTEDLSLDEFLQLVCRTV